MEDSGSTYARKLHRIARYQTNKISITHVFTIRQLAALLLSGQSAPDFSAHRRKIKKFSNRILTGTLITIPGPLLLAMPIWPRTMGYNARNDEIRDNVTRMKRAWADERQALATVRRFNAANGTAWFWPKIVAALTSKHHWLIIVCDSCDTVIDLDLRVKPRDPEASIRVGLRDVVCPRCNGHGAPAHSLRWRGIRRFEIRGARPPFIDG